METHSFLFLDFHFSAYLIHAIGCSKISFNVEQVGYAENISMS